MNDDMDDRMGGLRMKTRLRGRKRRRIAFLSVARVFSLSLCLNHSFSEAFSSSSLHVNRLSRTSLESATAPNPAEVSFNERNPESTFWHTVTRKDVDAESETRLPCVPTLDSSDPLPPGAYLSTDKSDAKATCRISVAVDVASSLNEDPHELVTSMQQYIDNGLDSFQLKSGANTMSWAEEAILGRLAFETPPSVLSKCHFTVALHIPDVVTPTSIRKTILESLGRIGTESIDCIQLHYRKDSPYHLDVLDYIEDLKREGLVQSVSSVNFSTKLLSAAHQSGFVLQNNQIDMNLMDPSAYMDYTQQQHKQQQRDEGSPPLFVASPLAGGLLTQRFYSNKQQPFPPQELILSKKGLMKQLSKWAKHKDPGQASSWRVYQSQLVETLANIALKHRVSIASVVLRWTLQLDHIASAVVVCRLLHEQEREQKKKTRQQELRQVFTFELDDDDIARLWDASGYESQIDPMYDEYYMEMLENGDDYVLNDDKAREKHELDLSNRKLWL
jgi:aryl-alcohol dehydrogenase-like predicted oxidoreductase